MKVIKDLICCNVPRGANWGLMNDVLLQVNGNTQLLPFPAEIIGLASELTIADAMNIAHAVNFTPYDSTMSVQAVEKFLRTNYSLHPTPDNDIIFLKRK